MLNCVYKTDCFSTAFKDHVEKADKMFDLMKDFTISDKETVISWSDSITELGFLTSCLIQPSSGVLYYVAFSSDCDTHFVEVRCIGNDERVYHNTASNFDDILFTGEYAFKGWVEKTCSETRKVFIHFGKKRNE
jgi:hypothetical protein